MKCATTTQLYVLNERLYKYILPVKPSFPEDYAGPLVDQYLSLKYYELENKKKNGTTKSTTSTTEASTSDYNPLHSLLTNEVKRKVWNQTEISAQQTSIYTNKEFWKTQIIKITYQERIAHENCH